MFSAQFSVDMAKRDLKLKLILLLFILLKLDLNLFLLPSLSDSCVSTEQCDCACVTTPALLCFWLANEGNLLQLNQSPSDMCPTPPQHRAGKK